MKDNESSMDFILRTEYRDKKEMFYCLYLQWEHIMEDN